MRKCLTIKRFDSKKVVKFDVTVLSYFSKWVKKVKLQMKAQFLDTKALMSGIGFLGTFKIGCDTNRIHKGADMWVQSNYVNETLTNPLNRRL